MSLHNIDHITKSFFLQVTIIYQIILYFIPLQTYSIENFQRFSYLTKCNTVASKHMRETQETTYPVSDTWMWTVGCKEQKHLSLLTCPYQFVYHEYT